MADAEIKSTATGSKTATGEFWRVIRRLGPTGPLAVVAATMPALGGFLLLAFIDPISQWLLSHQGWGIILYTSLFAILAGLALLPTYSQALLGGWAFGSLFGVPAAMLGFTGGALIGYFIAQRVAGQRAVEVIAENPKWQAVYDVLVNSGFWKTLGYVTLLRLPPNSPFAMTNLVMAATRVPLVPYLVGTFFGMLPRTAAVVVLGAQLDNLHEDDQPWWMYILGIALAVVVLIILAQVANRAIARVTGIEHPTPGLTPKPEAD